MFFQLFIDAIWICTLSSAVKVFIELSELLRPISWKMIKKISLKRNNVPILVVIHIIIDLHLYLYQPTQLMHSEIKYAKHEIPTERDSSVSFIQMFCLFRGQGNFSIVKSIGKEHKLAKR